MKTSKALEYIQNMANQNQPSLHYDGKSDICVWQKDTKAKLIELLKMPTECCSDEFKITEEKKGDAYTQYKFEFQSEPGYIVKAAFLLPNGLKGKAPVAICLQGHSTGMHISLGEPKYERDVTSIAGGRDFAVRAAHECVCAVAVEQRYMGSAGHGEEGKPSCATDNAAMAALLMGRTAIGERVWDIMRTIDVVCEHFSEYIDTEKIICLGNSGGGTATFYASCIDERIAVSVPSCALCTYEDSIMAMYHCPCNFIPDIRKYFDMGDLGCLIAPRKLVAVCGIEDKIFPLNGVEKSFKIIKT
ncbi:MAG: hypothetical protein IJX50_00340, partial [Clostridia bacterium]|nr:hypothetical protein [Clostridia bacterium]